MHWNACGTSRQRDRHSNCKDYKTLHLLVLNWFTYFDFLGSVFFASWEWDKMWWLVMLLKCCLQSWVHWFANCQTQNLAKTICCRKKHGKNPSIQVSPFKGAPFKGKWHKPCKSKAMCMHLKWNQCIHVCLCVWAGCIFSQLLSVGCSGEIAAAAEVKAVSAMMNGWLLFNWLTTLSRHTPASQQTTWFKMKQRSVSRLWCISLEYIHGSKYKVQNRAVFSAKGMRVRWSRPIEFNSGCQSSRSSAETVTIKILKPFEEERPLINVPPNNRSKLKPSNAKCPAGLFTLKSVSMPARSNRLVGWISWAKSWKCLKVIYNLSL